MVDNIRPFSLHKFRRTLLGNPRHCSGHSDRVSVVSITSRDSLSVSDTGVLKVCVTELSLNSV